VKTGLIPETRYSVNPDDKEVKAFYFKRHNDCIIISIESTGPRAGEALVLDGNTVISQLANALTIQNEYLEDANVINRKNQILAEERKEKEKDQTKKIHPTILTMLKRAAATDPHNDNSDIAPSCLRFINSNNVGMVQFDSLTSLLLTDWTTSVLPQERSKLFTSESLCTAIPAPQAISHSLHFTNKLQTQANSKWITLSVT
jgi:hypothetical protein